MREIRKLGTVVVFAVVWVAGVTTGVALAAAPANDYFVNAVDISGTSYSTTIDNTEATVQDGEPRWPNCADRIDGTVWYSFTADSDTLVTFDVAGAPTNSAIVVVYAGSFDSLHEVACVWRTSSRSSTTFLASAGSTYHIQVGTDAYGSRLASLPLTMTTEVPTTPANDDLADATVLTAGPLSDVVDARVATAEAGEPPDVGFCARASHTVWYRLEPTEYLLVTADTFGTVSDSGGRGRAQLGVYSGPSNASFEDLSLLICGTDYYGPGENESKASFVARPGTAYFIQAYGGDWAANVGFSHLHVNIATEVAPPPPVNDDLADATVLTAGPLSDVVDARAAMAEAGEPPDVGYCARASHSVWYRLEPTEDLLVTADTFGTVSDSGGVGHAQLGVYSGPSNASFEDLSLLICGTDHFGPGENESKASFLARAGTAYFIQAYGGYWGASVGFSHLHVNIATEVAPPPPVNDDFERATDVGAPISVVVDSRNAALQSGEPPRNSCTGVGSSIWYRITPAQDVIVEADTFGTAAETENLYPGSTIAAYRGDSLGSLSEITGSCDLGNSYDEGRVRFVARSGQTYYLQVGRDKRLSSPTFGLAKLHVNVAFEPVGPPPANDDFENATFVSTPGSFTETIEDARNASVQTAGGEPRWNECHGLLFTVWYEIRPTQDLTVFADTHGTRALQDEWARTNLTVLQGTTLDGLEEIASSCDAGNDSAESAVSFVAQAGKTYYLQVGRTAGLYEPGIGLRGLVVNIDTPERPANDDLAGAEVISMGQTTRTVDTRLATVQEGEPTYACASVQGTVWYAFTPHERSVLRADTFGTWEDTGKSTMIAAFSGPSDSTFEEISDEGCSAGAGPSGMEARVRLVAKPGTTYYLQIGESWGYQGLRSLHVNIDARPAPLPPVNDERSGAIAIGALPFDGSVDPTSATVGSSDLDSCGLGVSTVWWSLTPAKAQHIQAHTWDGDGFAYLSVWRATGGGLEAVVCGWDSATFDATARTTYYFMVSPTSVSERASLHVQAAPTLTIKVKDEGKIDEYGYVKLSGSVRCSAEMWVSDVSGTLRQRINRRAASGSFWTGTDEVCVPGTAATWTGWVYWSDSGVPFSTGSATVEAVASWTDPVFWETVEARTTATVKLTR